MYYVYRHYDSNGTIIYIGFTGELKERTDKHRCKSHWFGSVDKIKYMTFGGKINARNEEKRLIKKHNPIHNFVHREVSSDLLEYDIGEYERIKVDPILKNEIDLIHNNSGARSRNAVLSFIVREGVDSIGSRWGLENWKNVE